MSRFRWKWIAGLAGAASVVLIVAGVMVWSPDPSSGKSQAPSQALTASRLGRRLTGARTPAARYQALLATMRALGVGVYRGNGRPIVRGAERTAHDLYVYDFTLKALAANMANGRTTTVSDLAARLNAAIAPLSPRRPITGTTLRAALQSTARWAIHHPRSEGAMAELLIREIGLRRVHQDVAKPPVLQQMKLDDLQAFLVSADVTAAIITRARAAHVGVAASPPTAGGAGFVGSLCGEWLKPAYKAYKIVELGKKLMVTTSLAGGLQVIAVKMVVTNLTIGAINAYIIDQFVEFKAVTTTHDGTHYGPAGHRAPEAGKHLSFRADLRMTLDVPEFVAKCGYLTGLFGKYTGGGLKIPSGGDLPAVPVTWEYRPDVKDDAKLEANGTVLRLTETDGKGETWLEFAPKDEPIPGVGAERSYVGAIDASVNVQKQFGGGLDELSPNLWSLMPPKFVTFYYAIGAHRARGYQIQVAPAPGALRDDFGYGFDDLISISAKVCGEDPYAQPWTASAVVKNHRGETELLTGTVSFGGPNAWTPVEETYQDGITWELNMTIQPGPEPAQMLLQGSHRRTGSGAAEITENPDCPAV